MDLLIQGLHIMIMIIYSPLISSLVPAAIPKTQYHILFTKGEGDKVEDIINYKFNLHDIVCLICCSLVGAWYVLQKVYD